MLKEECARERFLLDHSPGEDFTNCFWQKKREVLLLWVAYRVIIFLYFFVAFFLITCVPEEDYPWYKNFIYFTRWSYVTEVLTFALTCALTLERYIKQRKNPQLPPLEEIPLHYKITWCFYTVAAPSSVVVTIVYCLFIYTQESGNTLFYTLASHVLNSVLMVLDFFLYAIPYRFLHFYMPLSFSIFYALFSLVYQLSGGTGDNGLIPIYHMLDWRNPKEAIATCAVHLTCVALVHCSYCVLNLLKYWLKKTEGDGA